MVTAYLFFVDLSVPLVFGLINYFLYSDENISEYYFYLYLIFSLSIYVLSLAKEKSQSRECQTSHSSSLSAVFFDTLDNIDCLRNPFSVLR